MRVHTSSRTSRLQLGLLLILVVASLGMNVFLVQLWTAARSTLEEDSDHASKTRKSGSAYSYIGNDHPASSPVDRKRVLMMVEESVHYSLTGAEAHEEWIWTGPDGDHILRLGEKQRAYSIPMFHQLHCLRTIREVLVRGDFPMLQPTQREHLHHCFNYIRQWTVCSADVTLEPGDFAKTNFTVERSGAVHKCWDWKPVYDMINIAWNDWERYRIAHNITSPLSS